MIILLTVVLPEPLSPTIASVSPRCDREADIVDGDHLAPLAAEPAGLAGKEHLARPSTSRSGPVLAIARRWLGSSGRA